MDMDAVSGMLPCDRRAPLPPRAPALPPKAHAAARIDWTIQNLPHKMATSPLEKELKASRDLIALYKEGIASKDADITELRKERNILETQIKASNALVRSANGMETLLQKELEAAVRVQNDLKKKLATAEAAQGTTSQALAASLQAAEEKLTATEAAYGKKVDHLSEAMHALTLAQMDLQASQRERRTVETINTSLSNELAAKNGDILALKEALRIAQRAADEVNAPTFKARLDACAVAEAPLGAGLEFLLGETYVKRQVGDGWVQEVTIPCPSPWCVCNGTGTYVKRREVDRDTASQVSTRAQDYVGRFTQQGSVWLHELNVPCTAAKHIKAPTAPTTCLSADQILCACAYGIPTHHADGTELSRKQHKAHAPVPEPSKKPVPAPAQVLPRAHVAGDLLTETSTKHLRHPEPPLTRLTADQRVKANADKVPAPAEPKVDLVSDDALETILEDTLHAKKTSTDDVLPALLKALDVVGKKAFGDNPQRAQEVLYSLKDEACNVQ